MKEEILEKYQIRKSNKQKSEFIEYIKDRLFRSGYDREKDITVDTKGIGLLKSRNIVVGNPKEAEFLVTAHYDTCAVLPFPNFMAPTNPFLFWGSQLMIFFLLIYLAAIVVLAFTFLTNNYFEAGNVFLIVYVLLFFYVLFGYRNKHTANDNTSGVIVVTKLLEELPEEHRKKVCVVYFDNEEKGLFGSSFFAKKYKKFIKNKMLINLDCVGDGDNIVSMAKRAARKDEKYSLFVEALTEDAKTYDGVYHCKKMKFMMFPSDQSNFDNAIGICALRKSIFGMYCGRIHTPFDTICREENIDFLVRAMRKFVEKIGNEKE